MIDAQLTEIVDSELILNYTQNQYFLAPEDDHKVIETNLIITAPKFPDLF